MSRVESFLGPQSNYESRLSFGQEVAEAYEAKDTSYRDLARQLAERAKGLLQSSDEVDKHAVNAINKNYHREIQPVVAWALNQQLEQPIGGKPLKWLASAPPRDIALFTSLNRDLYAAHQTALTKDQPWLEGYLMDGIYELMEAGYLPHNGAMVYNLALQHYGNWKPLDTFESGARAVGGYCTDETIAYSNMYKQPTEFTGITRYLRHVVAHELTHGAVRIGLRGYRLRHPESSSTEYFSFLDEALAEHTAAVHDAAMIGRDDLMQPTVIHPKERKDSKYDFGVYTLERTLISVMDIDIIKLIDTGLSAQDTRRGTRLRREIVNDMSKSFSSPDALFEFAHTYNSTSTPSKKSQLLKRKIAEITGAPRLPFLDFLRRWKQ